jgi:hypothetical protein
MLPSTVDRVPAHTADEVNERIREQTRRQIEEVAAGGPAAIKRRLVELDYEWDIERALEANAASVSLFGIALGARLDRKFLLLPAAVAGFLLQHALQGWCPPIGIFRRLGFRTQTEIEQERFALKALRGDFQNLKGGGGQDAAIDRSMRAVEG